MCASDLKSSRLIRALGALGLALTLGISAAHAGNDREVEQLKRLKLQLRQLQQDQASAQAAAQAQAATDKATMDAAVKAAKGEASANKSAVGVANRKAQALATELQTLKDERDKLNEQLASLQKQLADTQARSQRDAASSLSALNEQKLRHQALSQAHDQCLADNATLYELGNELLARYEHKGLGDILATQEPFIQTARVTLENTKAQYQDKLDAARLKVAAP